ncbi:hypothetical protein MKEN_01290400 [Mycena kentingensis (nom. inval.)]|nr:hypothetical protein MKEN_01290400 [Mycena kentingensis (nom. inval.)]
MHARNLAQPNPTFELDDPPYTLPEHDPFNIQPLLLQSRRRRSSMLNKWIREQQTQSVADSLDVEPGPSEPNGSRSKAYLAYPDLAPLNLSDPAASVASLDSYDFLEDDDIPHETRVPTTPVTAKSASRPTSFKGFHIPFRLGSPATSAGGASSGTAPRTPNSARGLFFSRASRSSSGSTTHARHKKSSSLSTLSAFMAGVTESEPVVTPSKSRWRPSVLGHFGMSQPSFHSSEMQSPPALSRPSISSNTTYTTTTQTDSDLPVTPPRSAAGDSIRTRGNRPYGSLMKLADSANVASSSFSVYSGHSYLDELDEFTSRLPRGANSTISCDGYIGMAPRRGTPLGSMRATSTMSNDGFLGMAPRVPLGPKLGSRLADFNAQKPPESILLKGKQKEKQENKPEVAYAAQHAKTRSLSRVSFASALAPRKKKKRLVISGIAAADTRKFEAAKLWCEGFGEVTQIIRQPNGDLHVLFRNSEVADTVCRQQKIYDERSILQPVLRAHNLDTTLMPHPLKNDLMPSCPSNC